MHRSKMLQKSLKGVHLYTLYSSLTFFKMKIRVYIWLKDQNKNNVHDYVADHVDFLNIFKRCIGI